MCPCVSICHVLSRQICRSKFCMMKWNENVQMQFFVLLWWIKKKKLSQTKLVHYVMEERRKKCALGARNFLTPLGKRMQKIFWVKPILSNLCFSFFPKFSALFQSRILVLSLVHFSDVFLSVQDLIFDCDGGIEALFLLFFCVQWPFQLHEKCHEWVFHFQWVAHLEFDLVWHLVWVAFNCWMEVCIPF